VDFCRSSTLHCDEDEQQGTHHNGVSFDENMHFLVSISARFVDNLVLFADL
jgi:hypothetical protein